MAFMWFGAQPLLEQIDGEELGEVVKMAYLTMLAECLFGDSLPRLLFIWMIWVLVFVEELVARSIRALRLFFGTMVNLCRDDRVDPIRKRQLENQAVKHNVKVRKEREKKRAQSPQVVG
eukprot:Rmarinus@m.25545